MIEIKISVESVIELQKEMNRLLGSNCCLPVAVDVTSPGVAGKATVPVAGDVSGKAAVPVAGGVASQGVSEKGSVAREEKFKNNYVPGPAIKMRVTELCLDVKKRMLLMEFLTKKGVKRATELDAQFGGEFEAVLKELEKA